MEYKYLLTEKRKGVGVITLNKPDKLNAIDLELKNELHHALGEMASDSEVQVLILTGAGRAFSSGGDLDSPISEKPEFASLKMETLLFNLDKPVIAAIHGYALGEGIQIAIMCDMIIAAEDTQMGFIGAMIGGLCYGAFSILPAIVGSKKANELLLTCKRINAEEALQIGLVNQVVPPANLLKSAFESAEQIMRCQPVSIRYTKKALRTTLVNEVHRMAMEESGPEILAVMEQLMELRGDR